MTREHYLKPPEAAKVDDPAPEKIKDSVPKPELAPEKVKDGLYAVDYFEFKGWGEILLDDRLDVTGSKEKLIFIESFLDKQIKAQGLKDDRDTFNALLEQIEQSLKVSKFHAQELRVEKVYKCLKIMAKSARERYRIKSMIMKANKEAESKKFAQNLANMQ